MGAIFAWWAGSAVAIIILAELVGRSATGRWLGIAIDSRGQYSLSQLQLALWTVVILSLVAGIFFGRLQHGDDPLGFTIPAQVLGLLGISAGSSVTAIAAKVQKNTSHPATVAASAPVDPWTPKLIQIFLQEEGTYAGQVVDITKFQNFIITIVLVVGYVVLAVNSIHSAGTAAKVTALPTFSGTFLILLGISHAAYLAGKIPSPTGQPAGLTVASRRTLTALATRAASLSSDPQTALKPKTLWQHAQSFVTWSDNHPVATVPPGKALAIVSPERFLLRWTIDGQSWRDDKAALVSGDSYAVVLDPGELTGAELTFTRCYLDQVKAGDEASGWEGQNHIVQTPHPA